MAAFKEYGLLFVTPRSNVLSLTPLGTQLLELTKNQQTAERNRRAIMFSLCRALSRYQFDNPLPVGGARGRDRATSSDVLPYLSCYYLLMKLNGIITVSELNGAIFGLQHMADIRDVLSKIIEHRKTQSPLSKIEGLPANIRTADNLKIYFLSHLSLDSEIIKDEVVEYYGSKEQAFEATELGYEIIESVLNVEWPNWKRDSSFIPNAKPYHSITDYFINGVGQACSKEIIEIDNKRAEKKSIEISKGILDIYDVESLKNLPKRSFEEGRKRLVIHSRLEKIRNTSLVKDAKRNFKKKNGKLYCEICTFDFEQKYGKRGKDYVEAHHKTPISELTDTVSLTTDDLTMVCSNCHRMLHRPPWITVDELRELLTS